MGTRAAGAAGAEGPSSGALTAGKMCGGPALTSTVMSLNSTSPRPSAWKVRVALPYSLVDLPGPASAAMHSVRSLPQRAKTSVANLGRLFTIDVRPRMCASLARQSP